MHFTRFVILLLCAFCNSCAKAQDNRGALLFGATQSLSLGKITNRNDTFYPYATFGIQAGIEWKKVYVSTFLQFNNYNYPRLGGFGFTVEPRLALNNKVDVVPALQAGWWSYQGQFSGKRDPNIQIGGGIGLHLGKRSYFQAQVLRGSNFYINDTRVGPFYFNQWFITAGIYYAPYFIK